MLGSIGTLAVSCIFLLAAGAAQAADSAPVTVASGVSYEFIGRWEAERLNDILTRVAPEHFGVKVEYTPARNAVDLYRVTYPSVIPEQGSRPTVTSGLVAVPDGVTTPMPLVSYQHGTVYGKTQVPSFPEESEETQLMIAQFAGQGYLLTGADYFGLGISAEPEGYMVKGSHQQATMDMIVAARAVLDHLKVARTPELFLAGWSQGGFVTMALLEKLESIGMPVRAATTASAPSDIFAALNGFLNFPRKIDASWVGTLFILSAFSYEEYYGVPGLARALINPKYYDLARKAYDRQPVDAAAIPTDLHALIDERFFDPQFFARSAYGRLTADTQAYRWIVQTPLRTYYGGADEAISLGVALLPLRYQEAFGNDKVEAISTGSDSTHRGNFARAVPGWKTWFDSQLSRP